MEHGLPRRVGLEPRWRDLPALALVQQRRFGALAGPAPMGGAGGRRTAGSGVRAGLLTAWSVAGLSPQLASLVPARLTGCLAAVDRQAVVRISPTGAAFRRRYAALQVVVGGAVLAGLVGAVWSPFLLLSRLSGRAWPRYVGAAVAIGAPAAEVLGSSARIARATRGRRAPHTFSGDGPSASAGGPRASAGGSDASRAGSEAAPGSPARGAAEADWFVAGSLAAWPPGEHAGSRLLTALLEACAGITPLTVDFAADPGVVDYYGRFGFAPVDGHPGLMRYSA